MQVCFSEPFILVERRHTSQNLPRVINPAPDPTPNPETDPSVVEIKIQVETIQNLTFVIQRVALIPFEQDRPIRRCN